MHQLWEPILLPFLNTVEPRVILGLGGADGIAVSRLVDFARAHDIVVHVAEPNPGFDADALVREAGPACVFHRAHPLEVAGTIADVDVAVLDGEPNWYAVLHELRQLENSAKAANRPFPHVLVHNVGWPYGRRDGYAEGSEVPLDYRQEARRGGLVPGVEAPVEGDGVDRQIDHALTAGGERNGVLTAIEDFAADGAPIDVVWLPGDQGLAILASVPRLEREPHVRAWLDGLRSAEFLRDHAEWLDQCRIDQMLARQELELELRRLLREREQIERARDEVEERFDGLVRREAELVLRLHDAERVAQHEQTRIQEQRDRLAEELEARPKAEDLDALRARANAELEGERQQHRVERERLEGEREQERVERERLEAEREQERVERERLEAEREQERGEAAAAVQQAERAAREALERHEREIAEREAALARLRDELDRLGRERAELDDRRAEQESAAAAAVAQRDVLAADVERLRAELTGVTERLGEANRSSEQTLGELARGRIELRAAAREQRRLRETIRLREGEQQRFADAEQRARAQLDRVGTEFAALRERLEIREEELAERRRDLSVAITRERELETRIATLERARVEAEKRQAQAEKALAESEKTQLALVPQIARARTDIDRAERSRAWRLGHAVSGFFWVITFRRPRGSGALKSAADRLGAVEQLLDPGRQLEAGVAPSLLAAGPGADEAKRADGGGWGEAAANGAEANGAAPETESTPVSRAER